MSGPVQIPIGLDQGLGPVLFEFETEGSPVGQVFDGLHESEFVFWPLLPFVTSPIVEIGGLEVLPLLVEFFAIGFTCLFAAADLSTESCLFYFDFSSSSFEICSFGRAFFRALPGANLGG